MLYIYSFNIAFNSGRDRDATTHFQLVETTLAVTKGASQVAKHLQPADELLKHAKVNWLAALGQITLGGGTGIVLSPI